MVSAAMAAAPTPLRKFRRLHPEFIGDFGIAGSFEVPGIDATSQSKTNRTNAIKQ
jgi:hypothetical protein